MSEVVCDRELTLLSQVQSSLNYTPINLCYEWQKSNLRVNSWAMDLKEEQHSTGLAFMWEKKQECNMREMIKIVKDRCNSVEIWWQNLQRKAH
jgi:hypothetical protein